MNLSLLVGAAVACDGPRFSAWRDGPLSQVSKVLESHDQAVRCPRSTPLSTNGEQPLHAGVFVATFDCAAPARSGAFADARRVFDGDEGGRARTRYAHPVQRCRAHVAPLGTPSHVGRQVIDERARPWPRHSPRALCDETLAGGTAAARVKVPAGRSGSRGWSANG